MWPGPDLGYIAMKTNPTTENTASPFRVLSIAP